MPVLEPGDAVLLSCLSSAVASAGGVADDPAAGEDGRVEFGDAAVAAVGEHTAVLLAAPLDAGSSVVDGVVAVAGAAAVDGDHEQVGAAGEDLGVGGPPGSSSTSRP